MNHYEIVSNYKNHVLLRRKGQGDASELVGKTVVLLFFVNDNASKWTEADRDKFLKTHNAAMETVMKAAEKFSVPLTIDTIVVDITVPFTCHSDDHSKWSKYIMSKYGSKLFKGYRKHYRETLGYAQIAVDFAFNKSFRAFAHQDTTPADTEHSVLGYPCSQRTIIHELFHQFGETVKKLKYPSIMGVSGGIHIDSLTAYAIGWSQEIDNDAVALLEATKHLKLKDVIGYAKLS